ncbi:MAG: GDP-mannose 4,6-dehydratase [Myxococcota bacterium]
MRVLVTGAAGFIGSSVAEALLRRGDEVVGIDNFNSFYDPSIKEENAREVAKTAAAVGAKFELIRADLVTDDERVDALFTSPATRPDVILHLAAWAGVRPSIRQPLVYTANNVEATTKLLERARRFEVPRFVFASSSSVYGARKTVPFREDDRVDDPISPYAATKKAAELIGYTYHHLHGISFSGLRFFTVYGPRQRPEMAIHLFASRILKNEPIRMHGDGASSRDYTYIDDIVAGVLGAIDRCVKTEEYRIYNLGGSETTTLRTLIEQIEAACGRRAQIQQVADQPGDVPRTFADISRARAELGYDPRTPVAEGIVRFVEWLKRPQ